MEADSKPSRLMTQDPQEAGAQQNKPSESQSGSSPDQNLVQGEGGNQQGTMGVVNVPAGQDIPNPVNPNETKPATTNYTTENMAYAMAMPSPEANEAVQEVRGTPPPDRQNNNPNTNSIP